MTDRSSHDRYGVASAPYCVAVREKFLACIGAEKRRRTSRRYGESHKSGDQDGRGLALQPVRGRSAQADYKSTLITIRRLTSSATASRSVRTCLKAGSSDAPCMDFPNASQSANVMMSAH